jgi:PAS domain S-box-containing protein
LVRHKDGSSRWVCVSGTPQFDSNGSYIGAFGIMLDIAERKDAEASLQDSEERYRIIAESTFDALILHEDGYVIQANRSAAALFGYQREELVGRNAKILLIAPDSIPVADQVLATGFEGIYEAMLRRKDGTTFPAEIQARNVTYRGRRVRVATYHDVSERKKAAETLRDLNAELERRVEERTHELQRQQMELNVILDSIGEGVFYTEGPIIRVANRALLEMTGYAQEELVGKRGSVLIDRNIAIGDASPEWVVQMREYALNNPHKLWRGEAVLMRKDGSQFNAALTFSALTDENNQLIGSVIVIRDITEEKRLAAQKAAFVANASHELRTPLTNIITRLYLLRRQPENLNQHLDVLERVAARMQNLVADLLDVSRFERGVISVRRRDVSLQELIEEVIQTQQPEAQQKNISLTSQLPSEVVQVYADPDRLVQVIVNLTVNAINYTPAGGRVSVELATEDDRIAVLRVWDTGVGIDPDNVAHVFEPFFRVNEATVPGTGLGLSISKAIVELHGGSLDVESTPKVGSTFTVRLPLSETVRV